MICTFIGHKNVPVGIDAVLRETVKKLIEKENVDTFYVGNHGGFDFAAKKALRILKKEYPSIKYNVVLAYLPARSKNISNTEVEETLYPEELENVPPKYAIIKRNYWMIDRADTVITYITNSIGNSAQFGDYAKRKGKRIINIADKLKRGS